MSKAYRVYTNNTDIVQTQLDGNLNPVTVQPGETVRIMIIANTDVVEANEARKKALAWR